MVVSEPVVILELDIALAETIGDFNFMAPIALQQSEEDGVSVLKLLVVEDDEDLVSDDEEDQQCKDSAPVHKIYYTCSIQKRAFV